jgi:hypothetical protein
MFARNAQWRRIFLRSTGCSATFTPVIFVRSLFGFVEDANTMLLTRGAKQWSEAG